MSKEDLSVAGPGSPISLEKFLTSHHKPSDKITVLLDQSGVGFAHDAPNVVYVTIQDRIEQAHWWVDNIFESSHKLPTFLFRYMWYMYHDDTFKTDVDVLEMKEDDPRHIEIRNLVKYCKSNPEAAHLIGMIFLVGGAFNAARKQKVRLRLFVELPETAMHPQKQARLVSLFIKLRDEFYGETETTNTEERSL